MGRDFGKRVSFRRARKFERLQKNFVTVGIALRLQLHLERPVKATPRFVADENDRTLRALCGQLQAAKIDFALDFCLHNNDREKATRQDLERSPDHLISGLGEQEPFERNTGLGESTRIDREFIFHPGHTESGVLREEA
jgi:hypothetical protein